MQQLLCIALLLITFGVKAQKTSVISPPGNVCGKVTDKTTSEEIPFCQVLLLKDSVQTASITTDINGDFCFKNVAPGKYDVKVSYIGYETTLLKNITVSVAQITKISLPLQANSLHMDEVVIANYKAKVRSECEAKKKCESIVAYGTSASNASYIRGGRYEEYNTEEYSKINDNNYKDVLKDPLSTFSIDVDRASYSNVRRFITQGSLPPADAVRIEEMINYFSYNYPQPKGEDPFSITTEYTECTWNKKHNLIHIGIQGKEVEMTNMPANNLTFLIDVSGSMESADKLPLLKSGLRLLVDQMRPQDKISLVVYAGAAGIVLNPTSGEHKDKILSALDELQAGGSTAGGAGILLAYKTAKENYMEKGNNRVILCTDGDFNVGVSSDGELTRLIEKKREEGVFLTVLGFGTGNYKDSKMEQLADKGNGNYAYIDNILEAKKVLVKEMGGTLLTIAKDVKIQIEFNPAKVKAYRLVGYENRLLNNEDFNDDKKDAGELGSGHTVTAIYEIIPAGSSELVASIDPLKYQQATTTTKSATDEVMTIKFRYKEPKVATSKLITHVVNDKKTLFATASQNCKFSCAVASFGMLLRNSEYKGDSNYKNILALAKESKGNDEEGYRAEFIRLIEMAELLK